MTESGAHASCALWYKETEIPHLPGNYMVGIRKAAGMAWGVGSVHTATGDPATLCWWDDIYPGGIPLAKVCWRIFDCLIGPLPDGKTLFDLVRVDATDTDEPTGGSTLDPRFLRASSSITDSAMARRSGWLAEQSFSSLYWPRTQS